MRWYSGFFLDTGVFIGISDCIDYWYSDCDYFFARYPFQSNDYYTTERVKIELRRRMRERRRRGSEPVLRAIEQQIKLYLSKMKCIVNHGKHPDYDKIHSAVGKVITNNEADVVIVTNGMIWSYNAPLNSPTLVTVDFDDIVHNKVELKRQASLAINGGLIPLRIESPGVLCRRHY